jgi:exodeoxyribonuclease V gamma subunit
MLAERLATTWPDDPFARVTVVVGSRGMERWLKAELATRHGSVAGVDFVFPGEAFAAATSAVFASAGTAVAATTNPTWVGNSLLWRVIASLRARLEEPAFARVQHYLGDVSGAVGPREIAFARAVTDVVERLHYDRPGQALAWTTAPHAFDDDGRDDRFIAQLLADLAAPHGVDATPAGQMAKLRSLAPTAGHPPLFVFGLSSLRPGDKERLVALAAHMDIHLFALVPSRQWWADIRDASNARRELRQAGNPAERAALLAELGRVNPLLSANGAASRDLQVWLEDVGYQSVEDDDVGHPDDAGSAELPDTRLLQLQRFLDEAGEAPGPKAPWPEDGVVDAQPGALPSIEIHACHGALRQCEALRDELLRRFAKDPTLEPRHVLVMTPDLETFAPLVAAVFGRAEPHAPAIPVHIADLGLRDTNPVAASLLDVLEVVDERVTATRLLELLSHEPVRAKFRIDDDGLGALRDLVATSGLCWAWDAADRAAHDQPAVDQNTIRFALERLALGVLMPEPDGNGALPAAHGLGPALPVDLPTRDQAARFGALAAACHVIRQQTALLREPTTAVAWRTRLRAVLDAVGSVDDDRVWQRTQVLSMLDEVLPNSADDADATDAGASGAKVTKLSAAAVASLLHDAFTVPRGGDRPATGAVTVCSMEPMRSVPFRVVALLGMDDGVFPRVNRAPSWNPFARPAPFEHDRRSLDRHLFLESILCARDAFLVFGRGFESARGERVPLSVVVEELSDLLKAAQPLPAASGVESSETAEGGGLRFVREHPLQPWSPSAFVDELRRPFGNAVVAAAQARVQDPIRHGLAATSPDAVWPTAVSPPRTTTATTLARALANAPACLLEQSLDIRLARWDVEVADREPLELDSLDSWQVRDELLAVASATADALRVDDVLQRHRARGTLPASAGGEALLAGEVDAVNEIVLQARAVGDLATTAPLFQCSVGAVDPVTVVATVPSVRLDEAGRSVHVWVTPSSSPNERLLLEAWLALLISVVAGDGAFAARLVGNEKELTLVAPDAIVAQSCLEVAVQRWQQAHRAVVPLVPAFSRALAEAAAKQPTKSAAALVEQCSKAWNDDDDPRSALQDESTAALFGSLTDAELQARADEFVAHAHAVWGPLIAAIPKKPKKKTDGDAAGDGESTGAAPATDADRARPHQESDA